MGRVCCNNLTLLYKIAVHLSLVLFLFVGMSLIVSAQVDPSDPNPFISSPSKEQKEQYSNLAPDVAKALLAMEERLAKDFHDFNDENFRLFDNNMRAYMDKFQRDAIRRSVFGVMGIGRLLFGLIFYFLNKQNRRILYESSETRRMRIEQDRKYMIDNLNYIKERLDFLEAQAKQKVDSTVVPLEKLDQFGQQDNQQNNEFDQVLNQVVNQGGVSNGKKNFYEPRL